MGGAAVAQETDGGFGELTAQIPQPSEATQETPSVVVPEPTASQPVVAPVLSQEEQQIQAGIVVLGNIQEILSTVHDKDSAEAAVAPLMRQHAKLQEWARAFAANPPLTEEEQRIYEERYLPIIEKLNNRIRIQGERLASAEYYGSRNLPVVLIRLALLNQ